MREWDSAESRDFAESIRGRRTPPPSKAEGPAPRGSRAFAWLFERIDLARASSALSPEARFSPRETEEIGRVRAAMGQNTKPFVLWNCHRDEGDISKKTEKLEFTIGGAATADGLKASQREGMPGSVRGASKAAKDAEEEHALLRVQAFARKRLLKNLLTDDLSAEGLGQPDPL